LSVVSVSCQWKKIDLFADDSEFPDCHALSLSAAATLPPSSPSH
jgi:hypothetical protein